MHSVSFILNGDDVSQSQIDQLNNKLNSLKKKRSLMVEYVLYFPKEPIISSPDPRIVFVQSKARIKPVEKAVASASGNRLIFTTINNALQDRSNDLIDQAIAANAANVWVEYHINPFEKVLGVRHLKRTSYIIADKRFVANLGIDLSRYRKTVRAADKQLVLGRLQPTSLALPDYLIRDYSFLRPYNEIFKHKWRNLRIKVRQQLQNRKAERLSRHVKRAPYSPDMPVFIICRDRVEPLKKLVKWCEDEGLTNIILIDNNSSYPPLLEYLANTQHEVIRLNTNMGHTAPWDAGIVNIYAKDRPYIVSDPDVIPSPKAHGAVKLFCELLNRHLERRKVGFGLRIDDLPDSYELKEYVLAWEAVFWQTTVEKNVFDAEIDTTFAVYRPGTPYVLGPGLRTGGKYVAQHEPWYIDSKNLSAEMRYYRKHANKAVGSWGVDKKDASTTYVNNHLMIQHQIVSPKT